MSKYDKHVSDAELDVLEVLWRKRQATVREICAEVYDDQSVSKYQSVQKLLERLESKGCVKRDRGASAHKFEPTVRREEIIAHQLEQVAKRLCGGSLTPLLMHLAGRTRLKQTERDALEQLIRSHKQ